MKLALNGIDVECIIGERADERDRLQRLSIDVIMEISDASAMSDELSDTVDYAMLTEKIRETLIDAKCRMIERAAFFVATLCKSYPHVKSVEARVTKANAIPNLESATAIYSL